MKAVFDTNILVDYLNGVSEAADEFQRYDTRLISQVSWMEVLVGCRSNEEERLVRAFLDTFEVVSIDGMVAESAVMLRRASRMRLPDAIVYATAKTRQTLLVTRDKRDFPVDAPDVRVPYELSVQK